MTAIKVRADYDQLKAILEVFGRNANASRESMRKIQQSMNTLEGGDWVGEGATKFFGEMNAEVLPALKRLVGALEAGSQTTRQISQLMQGAEDDSAALFKLDGAAAAALGKAYGAAAGTEEATIKFGANANQDAMSEHSRKVLREIMKEAKLDSATVTSTARTANRQAIAMYDNIAADGAEAQKVLYGSYGDKVIDVYVAEKAAGKSRDEIIGAMESKINELGPSKVSQHLADPAKKNIIDIAPSSISDKAAFEKAVEADSRVSKFLKPPADRSYHLEIPQPEK